MMSMQRFNSCRSLKNYLSTET